MPAPAGRSSSDAAAGRDPREPGRPARRGQEPGLARRGRRDRDHPGRRHAETGSHTRAHRPQYNRQPGNARHPALGTKGRPAVACLTPATSDKGYRVSNENGRTPPGDPWSITLTFRHQHYWWASADDAPETWHVSADIDDGSGPNGGSHVGGMDITLVDAYETSDPFALLDGQDAELGHVAGTLFDAGDGRLDPDLDEQLEPTGSRILILHSVRLVPQWRALGPGAALAGAGIRDVFRCRPGPLLQPPPLTGNYPRISIRASYRAL